LMAGRVTQCTGKYEKSLQESSAGIALTPEDEHPWTSRLEVTIFLGRLPQAEEILKRVSERHFRNAVFLTCRYNVAFLKGDLEEMRRQVALAQATQGAERPIAHLEAMVLAQSGKLRTARTRWLHAIELARHKNDREAAATYQT